MKGCRCPVTLGLAALLAAPGGSAENQRVAGHEATPRAACLIVDIASRRSLVAERPDLLRTPVLPGSVIKLATLIAAFESGIVASDTRIACLRHVDVEGRRIACSHPDVGHPLGPAEAIAQSCNYFFASVAARLRRDAFDRALLELGLPPSSPAVPLVPAALGLDGVRVTPQQLLAAFVRVSTGPPPSLPESLRAVILDGLRGSADYGTASAFHDRGLTALAKTGTAPMPGGGYVGLVVAVLPAERPTRAVLVMAPGAAGMDAARIAADRLAQEHSQTTAGTRTAGAASGASPDLTLRVGITRRSGGYDVVRMALEDYVARVVAGEAAPGSGPEARKALAVVARTFAVANRGRHGREGFDLCDLTHCQVLGAHTAAAGQGARATAGQVLLFEGVPAHVFYTASCGGRSERPSAVWRGAVDAPFLVSRAEPECRADSAWTSELTAADLQRALRAAGLHGDVLRDLRVIERSESGRVTLLRAEGFEPQEIRGEDFRLAVGRTLGWQALKSTLFDIERTGTGYGFRGSGRGHGVGLCVAGSARLAAAGRSAGDILGAYFPGTRIGPSAANDAAGAKTPLEITLPAGEERERARVEETAATALREFARKAGVREPRSVQLVFHATVEAYQRATGQPWWTTAATRGTRVDLLPPGVLRQRGLLEQTLRHELAHVVIDERLKDRPIWVREAAAMHFSDDAGNSTGAPVGRGPLHAPACPPDAEWRAIGSADALRRAYRRASDCFAAQIAAGKRWDEVR